jgi:hypothetical protein
MDPDAFNMSLRKFLKQVGVSSQREVENAVREAIENGELKGNEKLKIRMEMKLEKLGFTHIVEDEVNLE